MGWARWVRRVGRSVVAVAAVMGGVVGSGVSAGAHVEVVPAFAPRASLTVLALVVPNESDTASTIRLELVFPAKPMVLAVSVQPVPGWSSAVETERMTNDDGQTLDVVRRIVWTGGSIDPGQFQQFYLRVAIPGAGKRLQLAALQTYSDGQMVRWIERAVAGAPDPEYPAPVLRLTRPRASGH